MGLINFLVNRHITKSAKELTDWVTKDYEEARKAAPSKPIKDILFSLAFDTDTVETAPDHVKMKIDKCTDTIQGFCYLMAKSSQAICGNMMNIRVLQLTYYIDEELHKRGYARQAKQQKAKELEALGLCLSDWDEWSGDKHRE